MSLMRKILNVVEQCLVLPRIYVKIFLVRTHNSKPNIHVNAVSVRLE